MSTETSVAWHTSFNETLAERWNEYVDCDARLQAEGAFLKMVLGHPRGLRVLDGAMGIGCESIFLAREGYDVVGNEVDPRLRQRAAARRNRWGMKFAVSSADWRELVGYFGERSFDAVLILGNSLGLLPNPVDRRMACEQVHALLKPGGLFLVDQRNYDYMYAQRESILAGDFRYSGRIMYCEKDIVGRPTIIEPDRVRLACFDRHSGRKLGHFDVHPFRGRELELLVRKVGFTDVTAFWDFERAEPEHWDFQTLVCVRGS